MSGQLKEVRLRILSVQSTQQITKAMKMVSASKLRKAQDAVTQLRTYAQKIKSIYLNISSSISEDYNSIFSEIKPAKKIALLVISSDKGLCGGYNVNIIKAAQNLIHSKYQTQFEAGNVELICVGKKAYEFFKKRNYNINADFKDLMLKIDYSKIYSLGAYLLNNFKNNKYDIIEMVYAEFKNAATQIIEVQTLLPMISEPKKNTKPKITNSNFIFQTAPADLLNNLMPQLINAQVVKTIIDASASEHGARMTAMDKATDNSNEILKKLKVSYNRARQAAITTELSEIVSGAIALQG